MTDDLGWPAGMPEHGLMKVKFVGSKAIVKDPVRLTDAQFREQWKSSDAANMPDTWKLMWSKLVANNCFVTCKMVNTVVKSFTWPPEQVKGAASLFGCLVDPENQVNKNIRYIRL